MDVLVYAGPAPSRDEVLAFSAPIIRHSATAVTLLTGGGHSNFHLLEETARRLELPDELPRTMLALDGDASVALLQATSRHSYDLSIFGRFQPTLRRLIHGQRSKLIAQEIQPAVLRVQGRVGPLRRILLASGGDQQTLHHARLVAKLAALLEAKVTLLHVHSQQLLYFDGFEAEPLTMELFLESDLPEAAVLREAAGILGRHEVPVELCGRVGAVLDAIVEEARGHDLLVIGSHRASSPLDRILLKDITSDLLDISPVPVLVARGEKGQR